MAAAYVYLEKDPSLWWEVKFELIRCAGYSFQGAVRMARRHAELALDKATTAGIETAVLAAAGNLAQLSVAAGDYQGADRSLRITDRAGYVGQHSKVALADTAAQLALARGQLDRAEHYMAVAANLDAAVISDQSLWHGLTRIRYAIRIGDPARGAAIGRELIPRVERAADGNLASRMRLLTAEALLLDQCHGEAAHLLRTASMQDLSPSTEVLAETARVHGRLVARTAPAVGARHFDRAARLFHALGNVTAANDVARNATDDLPDPGAHAATVWAEPALYDTDRPILLRVVRATGGSTAEAGLNGAAALLDQVAYPSVAGYELLQLLADTEATPVAAFVARANGRQQLLAWCGVSEPRARALTPEEALEIPLGEQHGRDFAVLAATPDSPAATITWLTIARLAAQARDLHRTRLHERERTALWPEHTAEIDLGLVVTSHAMQHVVRLVRRAASSPVTVLITGETGTGKELLARGLHDASPRKDKAFIPFNCAAVPKDLLDAQLFGHRKGAFTGAMEASPGVVRSAAGGTLFLDEVGEIPLEMQTKLLRFLELGEIHPLGEPRPMQVDVRVVAATNANLETLVAERRFREDLYYRLNVVRVQVPPLRERREEVPALVHYFLEKFGEEYQRPGLRIADETMEYLALYNWPGNVRELGNEMRRMVALAEAGAVLMPDHLSPKLAATRRTRPANEIQLTEHEMIVRIDQPIPAVLEHVERRMITRAIELAGGRMEHAASLLGLSRKGLYLKRQRFGMLTKAEEDENEDA
jgi:DNA-binding NtrC family response regulator